MSLKDANKWERLMSVNIRTRRERAGLNKSQLAELAGISPGSVNSIEAMSVRPSLTTFLAIAAALETEPARFFEPPVAVRHEEERRQRIPGLSQNHSRQANKELSNLKKVLRTMTELDNAKADLRREAGRAVGRLRRAGVGWPLISECGGASKETLRKWAEAVGWLPTGMEAELGSLEDQHSADVWARIEMTRADRAEIVLDPPDDKNMKSPQELIQSTAGDREIHQARVFRNAVNPMDGTPAENLRGSVGIGIIQTQLLNEAGDVLAYSNCVAALDATFFPPHTSVSIDFMGVKRATVYKLAGAVWVDVDGNEATGPINGLKPRP